MAIRFIRSFTIFFFLLTPLLSFAQQEKHGSRIGIYGGVYNYFGDLNSRFLEPNERLRQADLSYLSWGLSYEKLFSPGFSGKLLYSHGQFVTNDRKINWEGSPEPDASNYARSLNARTEVSDLSLLFTFYFANGYFLKEDAFLSPYIAAGIGLNRFQVYGDLLNSQGERYYYWPDNTIRDMPEDAPGSQEAAIVRQDGTFETNLSDLETERDYANTVLNIPMGAGLRFRLSELLALHLDYTLHYTFSDYLDDVSGDYRMDYESEFQEYAANPTGVIAERRGNEAGNDWFGFASLSLQFTFGKEASYFRTPPIRTSYRPTQKNYALKARPLPEPETVEPEEEDLPGELEMEISGEEPGQLPDTLQTTENRRSRMEENRRPDRNQMRRNRLQRLRYQIRMLSLENEMLRLRQENRRLKETDGEEENRQQPNDSQGAVSPEQNSEERTDIQQTSPTTDPGTTDTTGVIIETYPVQENPGTEAPAAVPEPELPQDMSSTPADTGSPADTTTEENITPASDVREAIREQDPELNKAERRLDELREAADTTIPEEKLQNPADTLQQETDTTGLQEEPETLREENLQKASEVREVIQEREPALNKAQRRLDELREAADTTIRENQQSNTSPDTTEQDELP